jgi:hypothetical protein
VRLANATRGDEIPEIATAIDGSFYGELPLTEGVNEIEVEVVLNDGRRSSRKLRKVSAACGPCPHVITVITWPP